jgi:hypothetical protein
MNIHLEHSIAGGIKNRRYLAEIEAYEKLQKISDLDKQNCPFVGSTKPIFVG